MPCLCEAESGGSESRERAGMATARHGDRQPQHGPVATDESISSLLQANEKLQAENRALMDRVAELASARSDLQNLLDSTAVAAICLDMHMRITRYTPAVTAIFGLTRADLGRPVDQVIDPSLSETISADLSKVMATLMPVEREIRDPRGDLRFLVYARPYRSADETVQGAVLTFVDVTERLRSEGRLRDQEALLRSIVEGIPQLVWRAVAPGVWTWVSPQWTGFTGQGEGDALGYGWLDMVHPDDRERVSLEWRAAAEAGQLEVDHRLWSVEAKNYRTVRLRARTVMDTQGRVEEWFGTATDVHEMQLLQERQQVLLHELQHRVRNTLALVRSVARRTADSSDSVENYADRLEGRINAMSRTQTLLVRATHSSVSLKDLISNEILAQIQDRQKVYIEGPVVPVLGKAAENLSLAIHELTTNSVKHGALSAPRGKVHVSWEIDNQTEPHNLRFVWHESGLEVPVAPPRRRGFGTELIEGLVPYQFGGTGRLTFEPTGVVCTIELPLPSLVKVKVSITV